MKMFKKKAMISLMAVVTASLMVAAGCSSEEDDAGDGGGTGGGGGEVGDGDGDGDGDGLGTCESLCAATVDADCGSLEECEFTCGALELVCDDKLAAYLKCGESKDTVSCIPDVAIGLIKGCEVQALGLQECGGDGGDGGAGGGGAGGGTP